MRKQARRWFPRWNDLVMESATSGIPQVVTKCTTFMPPWYNFGMISEWRHDVLVAKSLYHSFFISLLLSLYTGSSFLDVSSHLYKRVCPFCWSIVHWSVRITFVKFFRMKSMGFTTILYNLFFTKNRSAWWTICFLQKIDRLDEQFVVFFVI